MARSTTIMPSSRRAIGLALLSPALVAALASCAGLGTASPYGRAPYPGFSISPLGHTPYVGTSIPLRLLGSTASPGTVMWSTEPYRRAWVTSDGVAHFFEPGRVRVIARRDGATATTELVIRPNPVAELVAEREHDRPLHPGDTLRIRATALDEDGREVRDLRPTFAIDLRGAESAAGRITDDGLFVAERPGLVTILVEANGHARSIPLVVRPSQPAAVARARTVASSDTAGSRAHRLAPIVVTPAAARRVRISTDDFSAYVGTAIRLEARVWMEGASRPDTTAFVTWESSDPTIALVDADGVVTLRRRGWVRITARHGEASHSRRLLVRENPVAHIVLQSNARYPRVGQRVKLRDEAWMRGGTPVPHARTYLGVVSERGATPNAIITEDREFIAREPGVYTVIAVLGGRASKTTFVVYPEGRRCELMLRRWDPSCRA